MAHTDRDKWVAQKHKEQCTKVINTLAGMFARHSSLYILQAKNLMEQYKREQNQKLKS
jgi:hypothetical protein